MTQNSINNSASSITTEVIDIDNINIDGNTVSSTNTDGNVIISPNGTGTVSITESPIVPSTDRSDSLGSATNSWDNVYCNGVSFDDGANVLDTYTEATSFTPTVSFNGNSVGVVYGSNTGSYSRIGNLLWFTINIRLNNKGTSVGACAIGGLPITPNDNSAFAIRCAFITLVQAKSYLIGTLLPTKNINVQEVSSGATFTNVQNTAVSNNSQFFLSGIYRVAT